MTQFDPYLEWLQIPSEEQPPDHYRLLGLEQFESDVDAINAAADQRSEHVRKFQLSRYAKLSQQLLNEIAAARVCLTRPAAREKYDLQLREDKAKQQSSKPPLLPSRNKQSSSSRTEKILAVPMSAPSESPLELNPDSEVRELPDSNSPVVSSPMPIISTGSTPRQPELVRQPPMRLWIYRASAAGVLLLGIIGLAMMFALGNKQGETTPLKDTPTATTSLEGIGEIIIDSEVDDAKVVIYSNGKQVREATLIKGKKRFTIPAGMTEITIDNNNDQQYVVRSNNQQLYAGKKTTFHIERSLGELIIVSAVDSGKVLIYSDGKQVREVTLTKGENRFDIPVGTIEVKLADSSATYTITSNNPELTDKGSTRFDLRQAKAFINSIGMKLVSIPGGEFLMGSPESERFRRSDEKQHSVRLSKPFYLQTTEVTQGHWEAVMGSKPWEAKKNVKEGSDFAVTYVSWDDAKAFCRKLSQKEGKTYRLPTEAEWEFACRGGGTTLYSFGNDASDLKDYAWFNNNTWDVDEKYAHRVGLKRANAFGLYDMHGNVWEWCNDWFGEDYYEKSASVDPTGPSSGSSRVLRGGSWFENAQYCRSANRFRITPAYRGNIGGFRVLCELD